MTDTSMSYMLFSPEAQKAFWNEMHPDTRALFEHLEKKERFTHNFDEMPELFIKMAQILPDVAMMPLDSKNQDLLVKLIPLLASMPLMQSIFAVHWLNEKAKDCPIGWGTLCHLEALNIINNIPDHIHYELARAMVDRVKAVMQTRQAMGMVSQWPLKAS